MNIHTAVSTDLQNHGGHLECTVCRKTKELGNTATYLKSGWPKCCGYTMTWITRRQELEAALLKQEKAE